VKPVCDEVKGNGKVKSRQGKEERKGKTESREKHSTK